MSDAARKLLTDGAHMRTLKAKERTGREFIGDVWPQVLSALRDSVARIGPQEVAWDVDLPAATVSHMGQERNRAYYRAMHVLYLLWRDPARQELAKAFLEPAGLIVGKAPELTSEELLLGFMAAISKMFSADLMGHVMQAAHREALEAKARKVGG